MTLAGSVRRYLERVGLNPSLEAGTDLVDRVDHIENDPPELPSDEAGLLALYRYRVPMLSPDGACSISEELDPDPFDLRDDRLLALPLAALATHPETVRRCRLQALVSALHELTGSDWTGLYERVQTGPGAFALRKEAYRGRPSRALFPLTPEFAAHSNNSTAALEKRAVVVEDVAAHIEAGHPYYECDPSVRSELCLPLVGGDLSLGLIDLESFQARHFGDRALMAAGVVALRLRQTDFFRDL